MYSKRKVDSLVNRFQENKMVTNRAGADCSKEFRTSNWMKHIRFTIYSLFIF